MTGEGERRYGSFLCSSRVKDSNNCADIVCDGSRDLLLLVTVDAWNHEIALAMLDSIKGNKYRILVVEDTEVCFKVLQFLLGQLGCEVDRAADGLRAVEAVERSHYDLIMMDIKLPKMDGYEATRRIRNLGQSQLKIFAMTAEEWGECAEFCQEHGFDGYVPKPVRSGAIAAVIERARSAPVASEITVAPA